MLECQCRPLVNGCLTVLVFHLEVPETGAMRELASLVKCLKETVDQKPKRSLH